MADVGSSATAANGVSPPLMMLRIGGKHEKDQATMNDYLFTTATGMPVDCLTKKCIRPAWKDAKFDSYITCLKIPHTLVTRAHHELSEEDMVTVAQNMEHSAATARKAYAHSQKVKAKQYQSIVSQIYAPLDRDTLTDLSEDICDDIEELDDNPEDIVPSTMWTDMMHR